MQSTLDQCVAEIKRELQSKKLGQPDLLCLMATGTQHLLDQLQDARETDLSEFSMTPAPWGRAALHSGSLGGLRVWALDDIGCEALESASPQLEGQPPGAPSPAWTSAFPVWLGAAAGAVLCVHTSAGSALGSDASAGFAVLSDHINLSGSSPLLGLGSSQLGPLFPDQSQLHHIGLRHAALTLAQQQGLPAREAIAACTLGPALETPAERHMLAQLGAQVSVQSLAAPLIACAHAGLSCLALVAVSHAPHGSVDLELLVHQAAQAGPELNRWLMALMPDLKLASDALRAESTP